MHVVVVGMNHRTAPLALRERLAVSEDETERVLRRLHERSPAAEVALLSTCNRFELYVAAAEVNTARQLFNRLARELGAFSLQDVEDHVYTYVDRDAVRHLHRVAAGLDSMVLGEPQILGQVTAAYAHAQAARSVGPILSRLFQHAIHAGKRVRRETAIGQAPASVGSAAVHLLRQELPNFAQARCVVVGAGTMARTAARYLRDLGVQEIAVVNRTLERARALAAEVNGRPLPWDHLPWALAWADAAVVATAAAEPIIGPELVERVWTERNPRPLLIVDIGVPRNVHPRVAEMGGVRVFDIDDLRHVVDRGLALRRQAIPHAEAIVEETVAEFLNWWRTRVVAPTLAALHQRAETIRQHVITRTLRRLPADATPEEVAEIVTRFLVEKLLQVPARNLRELALAEDPTPYQEALIRLFELKNAGEAKTHDPDPKRTTPVEKDNPPCDSGGSEPWRKRERVTVRL